MACYIWSRGQQMINLLNLMVIHLLTPMHETAMKNTANGDAQGNIVQKPEAILYYNKKMGGVDKIDEKLQSIQVFRKTFKWYHTIFFRLLMMSLLHCHKLYKEEESQSFSRFLYDVTMSLLANEIAQEDQFLTILQGSLKSFSWTDQIWRHVQKKHGENICRVCSSKGNRNNKTTQHCSDCPGQLGLCQGFV